MYSMKKEKNYRKSPRMNIGFYISLAVCIVAVAVAYLYGHAAVYFVGQPFVYLELLKRLDGGIVNDGIVGALGFLHGGIEFLEPVAFYHAAVGAEGRMGDGEDLHMTSLRFLF